MHKNEKPLNILQLTLSFENGGRKEAIRNLAAGMQGAGHKVFLGCVSHLGADEIDLTVFEDTIVFDRKKLFDFAAAKKLARFCASHNIDLIHTHDAGSLFFSSLAKFSFNKTPPQIMTFHRSLNFETASFKNKLRNMFSLIVSEGVITVSNARGRDFIASNLIKPKRLQLINLSADINRFTFDLDARNRIRDGFAIKPTDIVCGAMGHFGLEKGIDVVIKGFADLQQRLGGEGKSVHLMILGKGNEQDTKRLEKLISDFKVERVIFAGFHPDPESYFSAFDIFLHSPREENGATVLFEAMATGLPIVGSLIGGVPEAIVENETGLLVDSDTPKQLADAAHKIIVNNELRSAMGLEGFKRCYLNFTREHYFNRHVDFYREVLKQN
ncbi:glycosyltransferase family 4 protein [Colwellia sp. MB02u-18]|uniref:glycosyltransferase family 4 protein n=1 Tax=unclassified Colwellia TaxID=196834 RepID=UPI0015F35A5F|nr:MULTISPECIES: glycosyltransferase family 4 protein [unclassified Colwellia]MBA6225831.1 glycosyltransferase family 4 protein [Colwellia sp. MB3u-45]MBA6267067.1 glycosyltransferase family 4 protein [Colwellia sp. MB3u-43]MBA6321991.1 glycosyltransferase family 4 protein [Colwellia sp. MB02u-19]MBA6325221.1 glycosyltransferase family 4 protein [Colwellia sp. MB02u-18]MBA6330240.1 glycosyltransferase family 4 protein [Colwellia sp. MB02u-12]